MCGIVGYVQNRIVDASVDLQYRNALADLLYIDTLRGMDSTGVAVIPRDLKRAPHVFKKAVPGFAFIDLDAYKDVWNMQNNPVVVLGHNRAATHGSVSDDNAHPFVANDIMLVHNGTIRNQWMLKSGTQSQVDSCHIAHAIAAHGAAKVLPELDGAAVLVWYNKTEHSMNIARTRDRSIRWIFDEHGTCWYASEREMLWSVLVRNGIECKTGFHSADEFTWYKWALAPSLSALKESDQGVLTKTKFEEYVPVWKQSQLKWEKENRERREAGKSTVGESQSSTVGDQKRELSCKSTSADDTACSTSKKREEPTSKKKIVKADTKLKEFDLKWGDEITIKRTHMDRRAGTPNICDIYGLWVEKGLRVLLPDVPIAMWDRCSSGFYQVIVYNVMKQHIPDKGRHAPLIYAKLKSYQMRDLAQGPGGKLITKDEFKALAENGCPWCPGSADVNDHETTEWINGKPLCHICSVNFGSSNRLMH